MDLNNEIIEVEVIDELKKIMRRTKQVKAEIQENDKTPSWDGDLILYNSVNLKSLQKKNIIGRIPIQVKGKYVKAFSGGNCNHSVEISDLNNYYNDGGVIYFKGEVREVGEEFEVKIFYKILLPLDIKELLARCKDGQGKKSIILTSLNKGRENVLRLLEHFLENREKQPKILVETNKNDVNDFDKFDITPKLIQEEKGFTIGEEYYIYGIKDNIQIPLFSANLLKFKEAQECLVKVGDIVYFNKVTRVFNDDNSICFSFGSKIELKIINNEISMSFKISLENLKDAYRTVNFLIDVYENRKLSINNVDINIKKFNSKVIDIEELKENKAYMKALVDMCEKYNINDEINLNGTQLEYLENIKNVRDSLMLNKAIKIKDFNYNFAKVNVELGSSEILLLAYKVGEKVKIIDVFNFDLSSILAVCYDKTNIEGTAISYFLVLKKDELLSINFNAIKIYESISSYKVDEKVETYLINFILELIKSFDISLSPKYLELALNLIEYLKQNNFYNDITFINEMQILIRQNIEIPIENYQKILEIREQEDNFLKCCACLLMNSIKEFEIYFKLLTSGEREIFEGFPIYNLYKNKL